MDERQRLDASLADRYRVERELGRGGMATVYLADDLKHERKVALKVLRPELAAVVGAERFLSEIKTTANLQHPHILPLFDSGQADGFLYYVMPYVEGESLRDRLDREKQLPVEEAVRITRSVAAALHAAHERGVIHRDIKPENILLSRGEPLVSDFGIALAVSAAGGGRLTETGLSLGTPYYMSPEQATADRDPGPASDVYSLGCVLFEMLVGDPPHTGSSAQAVLAKILTEEPRRVTALRRTVPEHVADAAARALERLPADRFASAEAFAVALADPGFRHTLATPPGGVPAVVGEARPARARWRAALPWALAAGLAGVLAWTTLAPPGPDATLPPTRAVLDLGDFDLFEGGPGDLLVSPDGATIAIGASDGDDSFLAVRRSQDADFRRIPGTEGGCCATFSPDGDWLAYTDPEGGRLMKVSLSGGAPQTVAGNVGFGMALDWSPDGWILYSTTESALLRVRDTGGAPETLLEEGFVSGATFLPGGSKVAFNFNQGGVYLLELGADSAELLVPGATYPRYVQETGHLLWVDDAGALWAASFDPRSGRLAPDRSLVLDEVRHWGIIAAVYDVSSNGTLVYGTGGGGDSGGDRRLVTVGLDGSVVAEDLAPRAIGRPSWSPDGRFVAYAGTEPGQGDDADWQIFTYDMVAKTQPRRLTTTGRNETPVWSPDGTRLVFSSRRDGTDGLDLFVKTVTDDAPPRLLWAAPGDQRAADWVSAERLLIGEGGAETPWLLELGAGASGDSVLAAAPLFETSDAHEEALVSPQGDLVVYSSDASGPWEVYVRSYPVPRAPEKITDGYGDFPLWSADGNAIYYLGPRDSVWVARIDRGPPFAVVGRAALFASDFNLPLDLHPDGDRFIAAQPVDDAGTQEGERVPQRNFIVTNWFQELRARAGAGRR